VLGIIAISTMLRHPWAVHLGLGNTEVSEDEDTNVCHADEGQSAVQKQQTGKMAGACASACKEDSFVYEGPQACKEQC
jgi:hypothetical protein